LYSSSCLLAAPSTYATSAPTSAVSGANSCTTLLLESHRSHFDDDYAQLHISLFLSLSSRKHFHLVASASNSLRCSRSSRQVDHRRLRHLFRCWSRHHPHIHPS
jgi:hypothetical protein